MTSKIIDEIKKNNNDLVPWRPSVVKFDNTVIIEKVACGSSYSIALSADGLVYSWGLGNSGGLGLGE